MKKKIKVLHFIVGLGNGGAERQLIELLKYNRNHGVVLFTNAGVYKNTLKEFNIRVWEINIRKKYLIFFKGFYLKKIIKEFKPDIIQSWMYNTCLILSIFKKLKFYNIPLIWSIRCSDMNTKDYPFFLKLNIFFCKILSNIPKKIIYNSKAGLDYHEKIGFFKKKSYLISNGVDSKKFKPNKVLRKKLRSQYNFQEKDKVVLCVARVDPMKNHTTLLSAFKNIKKNNSNKNLKLVLIGKGTELFKEKNIYLALGMKLNIESFYNLADIIILPSAYGEGFSNVLVEGMLTNLLPISFDVGDSRSIINNCGYVMKKTNETELINIFNKLSKLKKEQIKGLGIKARSRAKLLYTPLKMINLYNKVYLEVF